MARVQVKDYWVEQRAFERRSLVAAGIIAFLILLLLGRLVVLQILRHDYYRSSRRATGCASSRCRRRAG